MKDVLEIAKDNLVYEENFWKYGFYHFDDGIIAEWIGLFL